MSIFSLFFFYFFSARPVQKSAGKEKQMNEKKSTYENIELKSSCLENEEILFGDYCIIDVSYEMRLNLLLSPKSVECKKQNVKNEVPSKKCWNCDVMDGRDDGFYEYPYFYTTANDEVEEGILTFSPLILCPLPTAHFRIASKVNIYILDTGVLSSHNEFYDGQVIPLDDESSSITASHGTHVAGIIAGKYYGMARGNKNLKNFRIFSKIVCESDGCDISDIFDGFDAIIGHIQVGERAVINLSVGGEDRSKRTRRWFDYYFQVPCLAPSPFSPTAPN